MLDEIARCPSPCSTYSLDGKLKSQALSYVTADTKMNSFRQHWCGSLGGLPRGADTRLLAHQPGLDTSKVLSQASWGLFIKTVQYTHLPMAVLGYSVITISPSVSPVSEQLQRRRLRRSQAAGAERQVGGHRLHHHRPSHYWHLMCRSLHKEVSSALNPSQWQMPGAPLGSLDSVPVTNNPN